MLRVLKVLSKYKQTISKCYPKSNIIKQAEKLGKAQKGHQKVNPKVKPDHTQC